MANSSRDSSGPIGYVFFYPLGFTAWQGSPRIFFSGDQGPPYGQDLFSVSGSFLGMAAVGRTGPGLFGS